MSFPFRTAFATSRSFDMLCFIFICAKVVFSNFILISSLPHGCSIVFCLISTYLWIFQFSSWIDFLVFYNLHFIFFFSFSSFTFFNQFLFYLFYLVCVITYSSISMGLTLCSQLDFSYFSQLLGTYMLLFLTVLIYDNYSFILSLLESVPYNLGGQFCYSLSFYFETWNFLLRLPSTFCLYSVISSE